ncbi:MAG: hypothetical protein Q8L37_07765 [Candidatus Gottesmanbacteria bacterium]|nr:hypothetical protein [Candidatus Gottesmanbacteria bacterium]
MKRIESKYSIFANPSAKPAEGVRQGTSTSLRYNIFSGGLLDFSPSQKSANPKKDEGKSAMKHRVFGTELFTEVRKQANDTTPLAKVIQAQRPPQQKYDIFGPSTSPTHDIFGHAVQTPTADKKPIKAAAHETAIAAGVVVGRSVVKGLGDFFNIFLPTPKRDNSGSIREDQESIRQQNDEALAKLYEQFGDLPLSEVGRLPELVIKRSQIATTVEPRKWLETAEHHVQHATRSAKAIEHSNAQIRAAQDKLNRLAARGAISTNHFKIDPADQQDGPTDPIKVLYSNYRKRLFRAITARKLPPGQKDDVLDDEIILDVRNGVLIVSDASKGGRPEPRPLSGIGKDYELKVLAPGLVAGIDAKLKEYNQKPINGLGWGRVVLVDRMGGKDGTIEVEVPMPSAEEFAQLVFDAKRAIEQATKPLDRSMVAVPQIVDLLPLKRPAMDDSRTIFDNRSISFAGTNPDDFFDSIAKTQPLRPIKRKQTIIPNERPMTAESSLDWLADQEAEREDLPF